ncbi:MAG: TIGR04086 family membrane protein [Firmicutes bacterium]|jgi:putative membrane protein (TIGR04086 family)|nr:TIGR04086 family membrane protein [Bacillota bacterium]MDH7496530.1 TIGR04086 family membrane protein [Bacillota bacterium]
MAPDRTSKGKPEKGRPDKSAGTERSECGWFLAVVMGLAASFIAVIAVFLAVATYDYMVSAEVARLGTLASVGSYVATAVGGMVAGRKSGRRGLVHGGLVGLLFAASILIAGAGGPASVPLTAATLKRLLFSAIAGSIGGMLGVAST